MFKDINISIAAGEALMFLENSLGSVSIESFEKFIQSRRLNVYLVLNLLLSEKLIYILKTGDRIHVVGVKGMLRHSSYGDNYAFQI
ncbi:MAG: hypothetical protein KGK03_11235 [Candidatus Omnitrophica bacterium]|nr:hypothetical protein [Candidatus Omnitrophota bacterium]MDE2223631.1 hypothetical protein [Candidatus Omnitrophota bacterium]